MAINTNLIRRPSDRSLFLAAAVGFPLLVLIGYFKTYYFSSFFSDVRPIPNFLVHAHGIIMTMWVVYFAAQIALVRSKNVKLHMQMGMAGIALAVLVINTGLWTAFDSSIVRESSPAGIHPYSFLIIPLADMILFVIFFGGAIYFRKRAAEHKTLMLMTALNFLAPALAPFRFFWQFCFWLTPNAKNMRRFLRRNNMRRLKLQIQMSIDGYVAGPNGEIDWMTFFWDDKLANRVNELTDSSDTILLGRKMTDGFINYWTSVLENPDSIEYAFARKMADIPKIVFSKTVKESKWINTTLANGNIVEEVEKLKNSDGKDILVYGGAGFVSSLIKNNLIDEYHLVVNPGAIGKGMSIFRNSEARLKLQFVESNTVSNGIVELCYEPQKT